MNNKARIASYLSQGISQSQVASIVNCSQGYISQLLKEAKENPDCEFAVMLLQGQEKNKETNEDENLTTKYAATEHAILKCMEGVMGIAELPALTNALRVVAERQEKRLSRLQAPKVLNGNVVHNVINLTLPSHAIPEHIINANREVIAIGNRQLAPMSADGVKHLFATLTAPKALALTDTIDISGSEF